MPFSNLRVVVTGAGRDFGRSLAIHFARGGAEVFLSARSLDAARKVQDEIAGPDVRGRAHAFGCDLARPEEVARFAAEVGALTGHVDVLVNNAARWLEGEDLTAAADADIVETVASAATGTILAVKHVLPLLRASKRPDIVTMVSSCGVPGFAGSPAHDAFYAAKHAQAGFADILGRRLRAEGIRVISLYPPDFRNPDPLGPDWEAAPRGAGTGLTAQSLIDCITFALGQPRDCFIKSFHFEPL